MKLNFKCTLNLEVVIPLNCGALWKLYWDDVRVCSQWLAVIRKYIYNKKCGVQVKNTAGLTEA